VRAVAVSYSSPLLLYSPLCVLSLSSFSSSPLLYSPPSVLSPYSLIVRHRCCIARCACCRFHRSPCSCRARRACCCIAFIHKDQREDDVEALMSRSRSRCCVLPFHKDQREDDVEALMSRSRSRYCVLPFHKDQTEDDVDESKSLDAACFIP